MLSATVALLAAAEAGSLRAAVLTRAQRRSREAPVADAQRTLQTLDTNHDGFVDRAEVAAFALSQGLEAQAATADFARLDANGDGVLDASELSGAFGGADSSEQPVPMATPVKTTSSVSPSVAAKGSKHSQPIAAEAIAAAPQQFEDAAHQQPVETPQSRAKDTDISDADIATAVSGIDDKVNLAASAQDDTAALASRISQELASQERTENEAHELDATAAALRSNLTSTAQRTAEQAREAGQDAANRMATGLLRKIETLEAGAQKAEIAAAALRAKAKAELVQADSLMEVAHGAMGS